MAKELEERRDNELGKVIERLAGRKKELEKIDKQVRETLELNPANPFTKLARSICRVVPKGLSSKLPASLAKYCADQRDVLEHLETAFRGNITNIQEDLKLLAACAGAKNDEMLQLEKDLLEAEEKNWDAKKLQDYMARRAGQIPDKEVAALLDTEFTMLPDEQKEIRKQYLLRQLRSQIVLGRELISTMGRVCSGSLAIYHTAITEYASYVNTMRPMQRIRDMAQVLVDANTTVCVAPDAIKQIFKASVESLGTALETAKRMEQLSVAAGSCDLTALMERGRDQLDRQLLEFDKALDGTKKPEEEDK